VGYYAKGDWYQRPRGDMLQTLAKWMPGEGASSIAKRGFVGALKASGSLLERKIGGWVSGEPVGGGGGYRRMNALNPKALRRAMRRVQSFGRFAKKYYHFAHRAPGKSGYKFPRRKRRT